MNDAFLLVRHPTPPDLLIVKSSIMNFDSLKQVFFLHIVNVHTVNVSFSRISTSASLIVLKLESFWIHEKPMVPFPPCSSSSSLQPLVQDEHIPYTSCA